LSKTRKTAPEINETVSVSRAAKQADSPEGAPGAFLNSLWVTWMGVTLFAVTILLVFATVLPKYAGLVAPDSMPFFTWPWRTAHLENLLAGGTFSPHAFYWLIPHPLYAHELTYILDTLVLTLGAVYYLRAQRLHPLSAWFGGLALGFCGYTFTLFSAGHRGYFHMFSCAVWAFGLIARGFATRRLILFALLGLVFAWGVPYQPDVLLLVGALASAYALWLTFSRGDSATQSLPQSAISTQQSKIQNLKSKILTVWPRFAVSLVVLVLAGFAGIRSAVTTQIANRDAQIAETSGRAETADRTVATPEKSAAERRERWLFATNWSLPPEDVLEFFVPGVFGNDSAQPPYPYWGRLGRPDDSLFQKGRMMPNYRQHTVYLGLIPLLLALFAAFSRPSRLPSPSFFLPASCPDNARLAAAPRPPTPNSSFLTPNFSDVPFWCGVWLVCLLLAMGRYTPLYRLFYAIPYMDYIRAPVKFLHLTEIATAFLAGFGMELFLRGGQDALRRRLVKFACGMAGVLLIGVLVASTARPAIVRHVTELGLAQVADALGGYTLHNTLRAAGLAVLIAGALWAVVYRFRDARAPWVLAAVLTALLCLDQATVARRYVRLMDLGPLYRENTVVRAIKANAGDRIPNVVNYATQNAPGHEWFSSSLAFNGIHNLAPSQEEMGGAYGRLFTSLQNDPVKLWRILHAQTVIVPRKNVESLIRAGALRPLLDFELEGGRVRQIQQPGERTLTFYTVAQPTSAPCFVGEWQGNVPAARQAETAATAELPVSDAPRVAGQSTAAAKVEVLAVRGRPGVLATRVRVSAQGPGLLVFDERIRDRQQLLVDGALVQSHTVDGIWPAALIPAGDHEVVLRIIRSSNVLGVSVVVVMLVVGYALIDLFRQRFIEVHE